MIDVDLEEIADKIVNKCMRVEEDEVIMVSGGIHNFELVEDIAVNIKKNGAFPVTRASTERLTRKMTEEVDKDILEKTPEHMIGWLDDVDGRIGLDYQKDPRVLQQLPEEKIGAQRKARKPIQDKVNEEKIRWTGIGYPTEEKAEMYGIDYEEFWNMFWKAINVDYDDMRKRGKKLAEPLEEGDKVHITSEKGTDLEFSIGERNIIVDDGIISEKDKEEGFVGNNLPCGEVFCAPIEDTANGKAFFDVAFYRGNEIRGIEATFEDGKLVEASAEKNEELFHEVIENAHGDKRRIGELGIGINPEVHKAIGYTITDEKIMGSIHLALGENKMFGGENDSSLHWDLVMLDPSFEVNGKKIMENGEHLV
ncbi:MAG: aminopeptidase [Candidatus Thermoplasmatota archaeon]